MTTSQLTAHGYKLDRTRVTWCRWDSAAMRTRVSHPYLWILTESDGYERCFDTKRDALAWIHEQHA